MGGFVGIVIDGQGGSGGADRHTEGTGSGDEVTACDSCGLASAAAIRQRGLTQTQAATLLGIDQSRVSRIIRGELAHCTIDRLLRFLTLLNRDVTIVVGSKCSDQSGILRMRAG